MTTRTLTRELPRPKLGLGCGFPVPSTELCGIEPPEALVSEGLHFRLSPTYLYRFLVVLSDEPTMLLSDKKYRDSTPKNVKKSMQSPT